MGEFAIFSDEPRKASVVAVGRVKALLLTRDKYMELYTACVGTSLHVRVASPAWEADGRTVCCLASCGKTDYHVRVGQVVLEKLTTLPSRKASTASTASH